MAGILDTNGNTVSGTTTTFDDYDTIRVSAANPGGRVLLNVTNAGTLNLSDELVATPATVNVANGTNNLTLGSGNDIVYGGTGRDTLTGGSGDDIFYGRAGNDVLTGGVGSDTADYSDKTGDLSVTLNGATFATVNVAGVDEDSLRTIENIVGGAGNDIIIGDTLANTLSGGAGNDTLDGGDGNDTLNGGDGNDTITDNYGTSVVISAGVGDDTITAYAYTNGMLAGSIDGGAGTDTLKTYGNISGVAIAGIETLLTEGNDVTATAAQLSGISKIAYDDTTDNQAQPVYLTLSGAGAVDLSAKLQGVRAAYVTASSAGNTITGGALADTLSGADGADTLNGGVGNDTLNGNAGNDTLSGGAGNDTIDGGDGNDAIDGGDGSDIITDNYGTSVAISGGAGNDTITAYAYTYGIATGSVDGGADTDSLTTYGDISGVAISNVETLLTSGGAVTATAAQLSGFSKIAYDDTTANQAQQINLTLSGAGTVDLTTALQGQRRAVVTASDAGNTITGGTLNDVLSGAAGSDTLNGGAGSDVLYGNAGNDTISGGAGNDELDGGDGVDTIDGGDGNDTIVDVYGTAVAITGGAGADKIIVYPYTDVAVAGSVDGGADTDSLTTYGDISGIAISNVETLLTSGGTVTATAAQLSGFSKIAYDDTTTNQAQQINLTLSGAGAVDLTTALQGQRRAVVTASDAGNTITGGTLNDVLSGAAGNDTLNGGAGGDVLSGYAGNDRLNGGAGNDTIDGGDGEDIAIYAGARANYTITKGNGRVVSTAEGTDTLTSVEYLLFSDGVYDWSANTFTAGTAGVTINGTSGNDTISSTVNSAGGAKATFFNDTINGLAGNDSLDGWKGADTMAGGTGNDTYFVDEAGDQVVENAGEGTDTVNAAVSYTLAAQIETLNLTGTLDLAGTGNALDNTITGNAGINTLSGGDGNDTLDGMAGADTLIGGLGNDTYVVDDVSDVVTDLAGQGTDTVRASIGYTLGATLENLILVGPNGLTGTGNAGNNAITGTSGNDVIYGEAGDDTLNGGDGADSLYGGAGDDVMAGGDGDDLFYLTSTNEGVDTFTGGAGTDQLILASPVALSRLTLNLAAGVEWISYSGAGYSLTGTAGADVFDLSGTTYIAPAVQLKDGDDTAIGGSGDDYIQGDAGNDTLSGGSGNDVIDGGTGSDTLSGGAGNDVIDGGTGNDALNGGADNDSLSGGAGNDVLDGGDGDDTFYLVDNNEGIDTFKGGAGSDTVNLERVSLSRLTLDAAAGVENLYSSTYIASSAFGGEPRYVTAQGTAGADVFDVSGVTTYTFTNGAFLMGEGNDAFTGSQTSDIVYGEGGVDTLNGGTGDDTLYGGDGDDILSGGAGDDWFFGGAGDDALDGGDGDDTFHLTGNSEGADTFRGGAGSDTVKLEGASLSRLTLDAAAGVENLYTSTYIASSVFSGGYGYVAARGTAGADVFDVSGVTSYIFTNGAFLMGDGNDAVTGTQTSDVVYGEAGDDTLNGSAGDDMLYGGDGVDTLNGGAAMDSLFGGAGNDVMDGGDGDDTFYMTGANEGVDTFKGGAGSDVVNFDGVSLSRLTLDATASVENLHSSTYGSYAAFGGNSNYVTAFGTAGADVFDVSGVTTYTFTNGAFLMGDGNDTVIGTQTADIVYGEAGDDTLNGGAGDDMLYGGDGGDALNGGAGDDWFFGGAGDDALDGGDGDDTFHLTGSSEGTDTFRGGAGSDTVKLEGASLSKLTLDATASVENLSSSTYGSYAAFGGSFNYVTAFGTAGADVFDVSGVATYTFTNGAFLMGDGNDAVVGTQTSDVVYGEAGDDTLNGGAGNDSLYGGAGADTLSGGDGSDILDGGSDSDTAVYAGLFANYTIDRANNTITANSGTSTVSDGSDTLVSVEFLKFSDGLYDWLNDVFTQSNTGVTINGTAGNDTLTPALVSVAGQPLPTNSNDVLNGFGGNDILDGGLGADAMYGGAGNDTYTAETADDRAIENADEGTDTVNASIDYTLGDFVEILNLTGSALNGTGNAGANTITGTSGANILDGGAGNDTLNGLAGNDTLIGGDGNDTLNGGDGNDILTDINAGDGTATAVSAGAGDDQITVGYAATGTIDGGTGADSLFGYAGSLTGLTITGVEALYTNGYNVTGTIAQFQGFTTISYSTDPGYAFYAGGITLANAGTIDLSGQLGSRAVSITASDAGNTITAGSGGDQFFGSAGNDTFIGGAGNDYLAGHGGNDTLNGGDGDDSIYDGAGTTSTVFAGAGSDYIQVYGSISSVSIDAGDGDDFIELSNNFTLAGTVNGGAGTDNLYASGGSWNLTGLTISNVETLGTIGGNVTGTVAQFDAFSSIAAYSNLSDITTVSNLTLANAGTIDLSDELGARRASVTASAAGNSIITGSGNDTLVGAAGADTLNGGAGSDALSGGGGNDTYVVDNAGDTVAETSTTGGTDTVNASVSFTLGANIERLTLTGGTAINGTGNELDNILTGNSAANTLSGGAGNDTINGAGGADTMIGGIGNDTYTVDNAGDVVTESAGEGTDTVNSSITYTLGATLENLALTGTGAISGTGNASDNILTGNSAANTLSGGAGNDTINGAGGADRMIGGIGNDTYTVDNVGDVVTESAGEGTDTVNAAVSFTLADQVERLTLTGTAALDGTGNALGNMLTGNSAANILTGLGGNDTINGGAGIDTAVYSGIFAHYTIDRTAGTVASTAEGTDTLTAIETLRFSNGSYDWASGGFTPRSLPTLAVGPQSVQLVEMGGSGTNVASAFIELTAGDADPGDSATFDTAGWTVVDATHLSKAGTYGSVELDTATGRLYYQLDDNRAATNALSEDAFVTDDFSITVKDTSGASVTNTATFSIRGKNDSAVLSSATASLAEGNTAGAISTSGTLTITDVDSPAQFFPMTSSGSYGSLAINMAGAWTYTASSAQDAFAAGTVYTDSFTVQSFDGTTTSITINITGTNDAPTLAAGAQSAQLVEAGTSVAGTATAAIALTKADVDTGDTVVFDTAGLTSAGWASAGTGKLSKVGTYGSVVLDTATGVLTYTLDNANAATDALAAGASASDAFTVTVKDAAGTSASTTASFAITGSDDAAAGGVTLTGTTGADTFAPTASSNSLKTTALADTINALAGNDTIDGGAGADTMIGGAGDDSYVVDNAGDVVTEAAGEGSDTVSASVTYTLANNVEKLTLTGTAAIEGIGNALANTLTGNSGANVLRGLAGNDTINGGAGADTMIGGVGDDTYTVDNAGDVVTESSAEGTDRVLSQVSYTLSDNVENLGLTTSAAINGTGNALANALTGNGGANVLTGLGGNDAINGGAGTDTAVYTGVFANYTINRTAGTVSSAAEGTDTLTAVETLRFSNGSYDWATGTFTGTGSGNTAPVAAGDTINWPEDQIYEFGTQFLLSNDTDSDGDALTVTSVGQPQHGTIAQVRVLADGTPVWHYTPTADYNGPDAFTYTIADGRGGTATGTVNINLFPANDAPTLTVGLQSTQLVEVGTGVAGTSAATIALAKGDVDAGDTASFDAAGWTVVDATHLSKTGTYGSAVLDTATGVLAYTLDNARPATEALAAGAAATDSFGVTVKDASGASVTKTAVFSITGSDDAPAGGVTITGTSGNDTISGSATVAGQPTATTFADTLYGLGGNDSLDGAAGADTMIGGTGDDSYVVDNAGDVVTEAASEGSDTVSASVTYTLANNVEKLTLTGTAAIEGIGNGLSNTLTGNSAANVLRGLAGNDTINGGAGADTMIGGVGDDTYTVDNAGDVVTESSAEGTDRVLSQVSYTLSDNVENLGLTTSAAINGTGNALANTLTGNGGANTLTGLGGNDAIDGGAGADKIYGGDGNDTLDGGVGTDVFVFDTALNAATNLDRINGFSVADDTIWLSSVVFASLAPGTLSAANFVTGTEATTAAASIIYDNISGKLSYDADGNAAGAQVQFATLSANLVMTENDFWLI